MSFGQVDSLFTHDAYDFDNSDPTWTSFSRDGVLQATTFTIRIPEGQQHTVNVASTLPASDTHINIVPSARVHPAMIPLSHPLASVREAYNAVVVEAEAAGRLMFYGPGAGGAPTASAVLGDLVAACRNKLAATTGAGESAYTRLPVSPMGDVVTRYHISLDVADKPGVLAQVATVFAEHDVSIDTVRQQGRNQGGGDEAAFEQDGAGRREGGEASLVVVTHRATDAALSATVASLRTLDTVRGVASIMRVEGE